MNIQTLCLSILYERDATGYEIRQLSTKGEYSYFVEASFGSIYPALKKLEKEGFVTSRYETAKGSPTKKIFSITDKGRSKFYNSLFDEIGEDIFRSEFLLFARFVSLLPASLVKQRINEKIERLKKKREHLLSILNSKLSKADIWVLNFGIEMIEVEINYLKTHMQQLLDIAIKENIATKAT